MFDPREVMTWGVVEPGRCHNIPRIRSMTTRAARLSQETCEAYLSLFFRIGGGFAGVSALYENRTLFLSIVTVGCSVGRE